MLDRLPLLLLCLWCAEVSAVQAAELRIVCIGDSITQGRAGNPTKQEPPTQSYRYPLWRGLIDAKISAVFVGSRSEGFEGSPEYAAYRGQKFLNRHEGYWGWKTRDVAAKLRETSRGWNAEIACVILGSNDKEEALKDEQPTLDALADIVATLRTRNPRVAVLFGPPFHEWPPYPDLARSYAKLAEKLSTPDSPVRVVALESDWVSDPNRPGAHTVDWVHPNPAGDARIAAKFLAAIQALQKN